MSLRIENCNLGHHNKGQLKYWGGRMGTNGKESLISDCFLENGLEVVPVFHLEEQFPPNSTIPHLRLE